MSDTPDLQAKNSGKARKELLSWPPAQAHVVKNTLGGKNEHFPDPNERVNENTNHEFSEKILAIYLDYIPSKVKLSLK